MLKKSLFIDFYKKKFLIFDIFRFFNINIKFFLHQFLKFLVYFNID